MLFIHEKYNEKLPCNFLKELFNELINGKWLPML